MKTLHLMSTSNGVKYHHTVEVEFKTQHKSMEGAVNVLDGLHSVLGIPITAVTMENKTVTIGEDELEGLLVLSAELPYGCFVENVKMVTDDLYLYDPSLTPPVQKMSIC